MKGRIHSRTDSTRKAAPQSVLLSDYDSAKFTVDLNENALHENITYHVLIRKESFSQDFYLFTRHEIECDLDEETALPQFLSIKQSISQIIKPRLQRKLSACLKIIIDKNLDAAHENLFMMQVTKYISEWMLRQLDECIFAEKLYLDEPLLNEFEVSLPVLLEELKQEFDAALIQQHQKYLQECSQFNADCYRLLLGERYPKVRGVCDENGNGIGIISQFYPGYLSFADLIAEGRKITEEALFHSGAVKIWSAVYVEEDKDAHPCNYGVVFDADGYPQCVKMNSRQTGKDFDTQQFPASKVSRTKKASDDMHYIFLLRLLIPDEVYEYIAEMTITDDVIKRALANRKANQGMEMKQRPLWDSDFQKYILKNQTIPDNVLTHFYGINEDYLDYRKNLIDIKKVKQTYDEIRKQIAENVADGWDPDFIFTQHHPVGKFFLNLRRFFSFMFKKIMSPFSRRNVPVVEEPQALVVQQPNLEKKKENMGVGQEAMIFNTRKKEESLYLQENTLYKKPVIPVSEHRVRDSLTHSMSCNR